ncbi:MAG: ankyrin repeat domain-containing protein [Planctomycetota bacterium]|nr:ankyrin repeat domain-containing protein [Planctomycetota bacterium]
MPHDDLLDAVKAADRERVRAAVASDPSLLTKRDEEDHTLFDHALWSLLVGDYSRPPRIAPDEDGTRMGIVHDLIAAGADVNARGASGWSPLHTALYENHVELTELLLAHGANPRVEVYGAGGTPLLQALFWGHAEAADALAAHDITPMNLRVAAGLGRADMIHGLVEPDGSLTAQAGDWRGYYRPHAGFPEWTPRDDAQEVLGEALCYAARNGRVNVLPRLHELGADVSSDVYAGTPLHWCAQQGRVEICRWLLDEGADVNARAMFGAQLGVTPLHCAAWIDQVEAATLLLERGADPTLRDETHDGTPLDWAEYMQAPGVLELLRNG